MQLQIKTILFSAVGALLLLLTVSTSYTALQLDGGRRSTEAASTANETGDLLLKAAGQWAAERGATSGPLNAATAASADQLQQIATRRTAADSAIAQAMTRLRAQSNPGNDQRLSELERAAAQLQGLRRQVDQDLGRPRENRDAAVLRAWFPTITGLIELSQRLRVASEFEGNGADARLTQLQILKHYAWVMSEYAGRERAQINAAIAAPAPLSSAQLQGLNTFRGRFEMAWDAIQDIGAKGAATPAIVAAIADIRQAFFTEFQSTREAVYTAGLAGTAYPLSAPEWFNRSTHAIDTVLRLSEAGGRAAAELAAQSARSSLYSFAAALSLLLLGLAVGGTSLWVIARRVVGALRAMTTAMQKLAAGDAATEIPARGRKDEIGQMAGAVDVFKLNMIEADRLRAGQEMMKAQAETEKKVVLNRMADEFEAGVKGIVQMVSSASTELQATAQSMSATAEEASRQSTAVAAASEQASTNVQTVAAAAEELSSSVAEISRQVNESTRITGQAVQETERTNVQIKGLADAAQRIGAVVKLINDIAGQTNLLALNATIEAARAGEAGKGFAVVASEVKSLATQTAKATEEISAKIAEMQAATGQSVQAVQTIGQTIGRINEIATTIASAVEEQGAATREIARNVQQASAGTGEVSSNIAGVTRAASDTGAAATQVLSASSELAKQSETLHAQVDAFIAKIRAA